MQTNQETTNALERRIDITVAKEALEKEVQARLKHLGRTVKMPGFRPGKVPLKMIEQNYGGQARSEAIGAALEKAFAEKVQAEKLRVAGQPRIEPKAEAGEGAMAFTAVFEVYPEITLGDVSDKAIERPSLTVSDAEVDKTIDVLRKQRTEYETVERAAAADDRVVIDFTGRKDGEVFEGGQASDFPFVLGSGSMLKDFEDAVDGLKAGETKTFNMTFPEDYHAANLAGQTVEFEITVKEVGAAKLPEIDAEFAKSLGVADGDVANEELTRSPSVAGSAGARRKKRGGVRVNRSGRSGSADTMSTITSPDESEEARSPVTKRLLDDADVSSSGGLTSSEE